MSGHIIPIDHLVESWQTTWEAKFKQRWVVGKNGKYYPKRTLKKCGRKDLDDVIATVR